MIKPLKYPNSVGLVLIVTSIMCWIILLFDPFGMLNGQSCHVHASESNSASFNGLMIGWVLMVLAMMLPKLISCVEHVCYRSLKRKRVTMSILFVLGYTLVWTVVGILMNIVILAVNSRLPGSYLPAIIVGLIALVWQFSPIKQRFLNKGHNHRAIKAFGWSSYVDVFVYGLEHGLWCFGAGWALMWFPMLLPLGHNLAMLVVTFIMVSEHMEHPALPRWKFDLRMKLLRIIIARSRMTFKGVGASS